MKIEEIIYSCERISGISNIPVRIYEGEACLHIYSTIEMIKDPVCLCERLLLCKTETVSYCISKYSLLFGIVRIEEYSIILGPIGREKYTVSQENDFSFDLGISLGELSSLITNLFKIPHMPLSNFLHMLLLINFYFNGEKLLLSDIAPSIQIDDISDINLSAEIEIKGKGEKITVHNTLAFERQMLTYIRNGDTAKLKAFLTSQAHGDIGVLSENRLRQQKNLLIVSATLASRAAISGGMTEDEAMTLSDFYIRSCEKLFSEEAILKLQYHMVVDFAEKVCISDINARYSPLIAEIITYIRSHLSESMQGTRLADQFNISRNTLNVRFKQETKQTLGDFILSERIKRAKNLLKYTDKSLLEISDYLGFASQSHFQTRFKDITGTTPLNFRRIPV